MGPEPEVRFPDSYDDLYALEVESKGFLPEVEVSIPGEGRFSVTFLDIHRLQQDFAAELENGNHYLAEPNLIVVDRVTRATMEHTIKALCKGDYFRRLGKTAVGM